MKENAELQKLKVRAIYKRLDYKGVVHTDVVEREIPWKGYDPEAFIKTICLSGDVSQFEKPFDGNYCDFMHEYFGIVGSDLLRRPYAVETEAVSGCKFVFYSPKSNSQLMQWENI